MDTNDEGVLTTTQHATNTLRPSSTPARPSGDLLLESANPRDAAGMSQVTQHSFNASDISIATNANIPLIDFYAAYGGL